MLRALANCHFNGWRRSVGIRVLVLTALVLLDHCLHRVAQQLPNDILKVAENIRETSLQVTVNIDLGDGNIRPVGALRNIPNGFPAALDNILGYTLEKDLANELGFRELGTR